MKKKCLCTIVEAPRQSLSQLHKSLDATLRFGSMSWYSDVSEAVLYVTSGRDIFLYYRLIFGAKIPISRILA